MKVLASFGGLFCRLCGGAVVTATRTSGGGAARVRSQLECDDSLRGPFWGIWIDGRSAAKGPNAYGKPYAELLNASMHSLYQADKGSNDGLQLGTFLRIKSLLGYDWCSGTFLQDHPIALSLRKCFADNVPKNVISSILDDVAVYDKELRPTWQGEKAVAIQSLFETYNSKMGSASSIQEKLVAISWLMRNMAFLHPLIDGNGRSRLFLLQLELRRNGIACGTMNYNNNQNVYFDTEKTYVEKLKEGIDMYNMAQRSGTNPWQQESNVKAHRARFKTKYTEPLQRCWRSICGPQSLRGGGDGCAGTSIEF